MPLFTELSLEVCASLASSQDITVAGASLLALPSTNLSVFGAILLAKPSSNFIFRVNFRDMDGLDGYGFDSIQSLQIVSWSR
jgi:hypothetical protein